jgi:hypothetical protein
MSKIGRTNIEAKLSPTLKQLPVDLVGYDVDLILRSVSPMSAVRSRHWERKFFCFLPLSFAPVAASSAQYS